MSDEFLNSMKMVVEYTEATTDLASRLSAQVVALTICVQAMRVELLSTQRHEANQRFRIAIEDLMAILDDRVIPGPFHAALLEETNRLISILAKAT